MRVYTRIIINSETSELISREGYDYEGPVLQCKASDAENALSAEQSAFFQTLQNDYKTQFASQTNILNSLNSTFQPILAGGIGQFGFTPAEEAALRTGALEQVGGAYKNASTAVSEMMAARGGGNVSLPSGADAQVMGTIASQAAAAESGAQNQITQAGYAVGRQNFLEAANVLGGVAKMYDPAAYGDLANKSGSQAFNEANIIQQQNNAWKGELGGTFAGIAGAFLGGPMGAQGATQGFKAGNNPGYGTGPIGSDAGLFSSTVPTNLGGSESGFGTDWLPSGG
jgi:hypothetical protein